MSPPETFQRLCLRGDRREPAALCPVPKSDGRWAEAEGPRRPLCSLHKVAGLAAWLSPVHWGTQPGTCFVRTRRNGAIGGPLRSGTKNPGPSLMGTGAAMPGHVDTQPRGGVPDTHLAPLHLASR